MNTYEKDLNDLKEQILKDSNTLVSKRDLLERFCEIDKEYEGQPWNLLQILTNINILVGEEPCEDWLSRQVVSDFLEGHAKDFEDVPSVTPTRKKGKWIFSKTIFDKHGFTAECQSCHKKWKTYDEIRWRKENKFCPNCGAEIRGDEYDRD
jgi:hypothetical protein